MFIGPVPASQLSYRLPPQDLKRNLPDLASRFLLHTLQQILRVDIQ